MALLPWNDDEEQNEITGVTPVKRVVSVQDGAWQPSASGANKPANNPLEGNYLFSEEKAQFDQQQEQRRQAEAQAAAAAAAAQAQAQAAAQARAQQVENVPPSRRAANDPNIVEAGKNDDGWKKYYDKAFQQERREQGFFGRLIDGGAASRNAEVIARAKYQRELQQNNEVERARAMGAHNSNLAYDNSRRAAALVKAGAADKVNPSILEQVRGTANNLRTMSLYDAIFGVDDKHKTGMDDLFRFGGNVIQAVPTAPYIGSKSIIDAVRGRGTDYETGEEKDLNSGERIGRAISGAVDIAGAFFGGSEKLIKSVAQKAAQKTATEAEKALLKRAVAEFVVPALIEGGENGVQAAADYFGEGGALRDENGEIDLSKVGQFLTQVGSGAALGTLAGGVFAGTAAGVNRVRNSPKMNEGGYIRMPGEDITEGLSREQAEFINAYAEMLEGMGTGNGVSVNPETNTRISNNVRDAETKGKNMSKYDWFEKARRDIESGKAMYGASDDYVQLPGITQDTPETSTQMPQDATPVRDVPEVDAPEVDTPEIDAPKDVTPVADGVSRAGVTPVARDVPVVPTEQVKALKEARVGKSQAEEAVINQQIKEAEAAVPKVDTGGTPPAKGNLPDDMGGEAPKPKKKLSPSEQGRKDFSDRFQQGSGNPRDLKAQVARAVGMEKDAGLDIADLTKDMKPAAAKRVTDLYEKIEKIYKDSTQTARTNRKNFMAGEDVDMDINRKASSDTAERGVLESQLRNEIRALQRKGDIGERAVQALENLVAYRSANMLNSASVIEKAYAGDIAANVINTVKNPIKQIKGMTQHGNVFKSGAKASVRGWRVAPKNASETLSYITGNTLKTAFTPVEIAARARRGALRTELTQWAHKQITGKDLTSKEAAKLAKTASNHTEMLVAMGAGVDNFMVSATQFNRALKHWKGFMETGSKAELLKFEKVAEAQSTLANRLAEGFKKPGTKNKGARALTATANAIFPFVRVAYNAANTGVTKTLNPFSKSVLDSIRADQRGLGANAVKIIQNKLVDYGLLGGAAMLAGGGMLVYNDGDEVDKPRGWSIDVGDDKFVPIRATPIEFPLAVAGATREIIKDIENDDFRGVDHYVKMVGGSLPYLDQLEQNTKVLDSLTNLGGKEGDGGYAAKQYATNLARSVTPFSNNSAMPVVERWKGNSVNAKSTYDKDSMKQTYLNTLKNAYNVNRDSLKDSRDSAGRVRTVDNQGAVINKRINDANTAEFNTKITDLVDFGRKNGLGKNTQDMFNTYDTGKNNNFKSTMDSITFLDVADGESPDNAKKLEKNEKLTDLSRQIREGFFGTTGMDLLTLDGKNLYSDVSVPVKSGAKNSSLPINMQSIKNAVAATDLPKEQRDRMYELSQANQALYERRKNKEITYDQEQALKAQNEEEYVEILSSSKNYQRMQDLFNKLDNEGFFEADGLGSTKSGQTYLWNALNALLGSKGKTPAANYPDSGKGFTPWGRRGGGGGRSGSRASMKFGDRNNKGLQWTPVKARQMAAVKTGRYTPAQFKVKLNNRVKKDKSQNYSDRTI